MDPLGLTPTERQVAAALADGQTVQGIAATLDRSVATIYSTRSISS